MLGGYSLKPPAAPSLCCIFRSFIHAFLILVEKLKNSEFPPSIFTERKKDIDSAKSKSVRITVSYYFDVSTLMAILCHQKARIVSSAGRQHRSCLTIL